MRPKFIIASLLLFHSYFSPGQNPSFQAVYNNTAGIESNHIYGLASDTSGNVFFCGNLIDSVNIAGIGLSPNSGGAFIGKRDISGNLIWMNQGGSPVPYFDNAFGVDTDQQGNVYVCGTIDGTQTAHFGATTLLSGSNGFVAKYSPAGALLWARGHQAPVYSITVDNNNQPIINYGDIYLYRIYPNSGAIVPFPSGFISGNQLQQWKHNIVISSGNDIFFQAGNKIMKFDNAFNLLWSTPVSTIQPPLQTFRITIDNLNDVYGSFNVLPGGSVTIGPFVTSDNFNGYIFKLDAATGSLVFVDSILISGVACGVQEVIPDNLGNYYFFAAGTNFLNHLVKLNSVYSVLWDNLMTGYCGINAMVLLGPDCLSFGGNHTAVANFGSYTITMPPGGNGNMTNSFLGNVCVPLGGSELPVLLPNQLQVYPVPGKDVLYVHGGSFSELRISDMSGKIVAVNISGTRTFDISKLHSGMYMLTAITKNSKAQTIKFTVEK
jgi:hypothetical protein